MTNVYHLLLWENGQLLVRRLAGGACVLPLRRTNLNVRCVAVLVDALESLGVEGVIRSVEPRWFDPEHRELHWACDIVVSTVKPAVQRWTRVHSADRLSPPIDGASPPKSLPDEWFAIVVAATQTFLATHNHAITDPRPRQLSVDPSRTLTMFHTTRGPVYARFSADRPFTEAQLVTLIWRTRQSAVPEPLLASPLTGLLISAQAPGEPLSVNPPLRATIPAAARLALTQRSLRCLVGQFDELNVPRLDTGWMTARCKEAAASNPGLARTALLAEEAIASATDDLLIDAGPLTWVDADWAPGNLFHSEDGICCVDLEYSLVAPAILGFAVFANRFSTGQWPPSWVSAALEAYSGSWPDAVAMRPAPTIDCLRRLAAVAEFWRYLRSLMTFAHCRDYPRLVDVTFPAAVRLLAGRDSTHHQRAAAGCSGA